MTAPTLQLWYINYLVESTSSAAACGHGHGTACHGGWHTTLLLRTAAPALQLTACADATRVHMTRRYLDPRLFTHVSTTVVTLSKREFKGLGILILTFSSLSLFI